MKTKFFMFCQIGGEFVKNRQRLSAVFKRARVKYEAARMRYALLEISVRLICVCKS